MSKSLPTFHQIWLRFRRRTIDDHLVDPATKKAMKDVFYAGAMDYINAMRKAFDQDTTGDAFKKYHMLLEDEIRSHFEYFEATTVH